MPELDLVLWLGGGLALLLALVGAVVASRLRVAGPNQAFVVTGRKGRTTTDPETGELVTDLSGQKVVMGASIFVLPFVQRLAVLDLSSRQISVSVGGAVSAQGIKCSLEGVVVVKIGGTADAVRAAAQRFLNQQNEINHFTQEVMAGSLRAIVGRLTVEEIIRDRAAFAREVSEEAESSLTNQGLVLDTFQLQDIRTDGSYLTDLGRPEAARAEKEASIAEANARREAEEARIKAEEAIAVADRELALRQASIKAETDSAAANANAAGPLAKAAKDEEVLTAQERVAERRAELTERELDTDIRRPADAARYAAEQEAAAARYTAEQEAEAEKTALTRAAEGQRAARLAAADAVKVEGEAEADATRARAEGERAARLAIAHAVQVEGEAEAATIRARGEGEADAMARKAEAYQKYDQAAVIDLLTSALPDVVRGVSEPLSTIDKLTVISTDGAGAITKSVTDSVTQSLQIASDLLGLDVGAIIRRYLDGDGTPADSPAAVEHAGAQPDGESLVVAGTVQPDGGGRQAE
jgi:flotillin